MKRGKLIWVLIGLIVVIGLVSVVSSKQTITGDASSGIDCYDKNDPKGLGRLNKPFTSPNS